MPGYDPAVHGDAVVITGATATGKTRLAVALARRVGGEVISMDSRQVYRGMDIGTAKPTTAEREGVPHHGFDIVDPDEKYSAGRFARDARKWIEAILARGRVPILAGGTGFFLRSLTHPLFDEPPLDEQRRDRLRAWLMGQSVDSLRAWVLSLEPGIDLGEWGGGGRQRLIRRVEVAILTGRALSWWQSNSPSGETPLAPRVFLLEVDRPELDRRIERRVLDMVEAGLVNEVRSLLNHGYGAGDPGMNATGYAEFIPCISGERTVEEAIELTQNATRRYARRQMTWCRNQLEGHVTRIDGALPLELQLEHIVAELKGVAT